MISVVYAHYLHLILAEALIGGFCHAANRGVKPGAVAAAGKHSDSFHHKALLILFPFILRGNILHLLPFII